MAGPNASVHAYAAAQVKAAMDATKRLGGENYVFWGGREGYHTLLNTDLKSVRSSNGQKHQCPIQGPMCRVGWAFSVSVL
jgi:xylose isomerase